MQISPEQQKVIDSQKEHCPICKIIKGEIPSNKVYEDDKLIAILEINPASEGHTLLIPKEHYPIMMWMPKETFQHLFDVTTQLIGALKRAMLVSNVEMLISNGPAAGQKSGHFMMHIIPREKKGFELKKNIDKNQIVEILPVLSQNLKLMMQKNV